MPAATAKLMTIEEFLQLPEDENVDRELINGDLKEWPAVTLRNRKHSKVMMRIGQLLADWADGQDEFQGEVLGGEAGFRLRREPDTYVGIDVAVATAESLANTAESDPYVNGPPLLAVEIPAPSDLQERVDQKILSYLECGVALVWTINPNLRTVVVHRQDAEPVMFNVEQTLAAEPHLPGFEVAVSRIFA